MNADKKDSEKESKKERGIERERAADRQKRPTVLSGASFMKGRTYFSN